MSQLSGDLVRHHLSTYVFGQNVVYTEKTGSTNTELKQLARTDAPEGLLYLTNEQLVGRGRLKRSWIAPPGSSLLTSLLFRPGNFLEPVDIQRLTMLVSLAMVDSIETHTGLLVDLKWPNDLIWTDGKKIGGILTESEIERAQISWVVVGLGLNVNLDFNLYTAEDRLRQEERQPSLARSATSLSTILEKDVSDLRLPILKSYLVNVERRYERLKNGHRPHQEWQERLSGLGRQVTVTNIHDESRLQGKMIGVDNHGGLLIERAGGSVVTVLAGDVSLK